jgi:hypothetical protein
VPPRRRAGRFDAFDVFRAEAVRETGFRDAAFRDAALRDVDFRDAAFRAADFRVAVRRAAAGRLLAGRLAGLAALRAVFDRFRAALRAGRLAARRRLAPAGRRDDGFDRCARFAPFALAIVPGPFDLTMCP